MARTHKYSPDEVRAKLHASVQKITAEEDLKSLTTRKITLGCGLSDPYLYQHYDGIPELLEDSFLQIDKEIGWLLGETISKLPHASDDKHITKTDCREIWLVYWNFLLEDSNRTIFYWRYSQSGYCTDKIGEKRRELHSKAFAFVQRVAAQYHPEQNANIPYMLSTLYDTTLLSAVKVLLKKDGLHNTKQTREAVFRTAFAQFYTSYEPKGDNCTDNPSD